MNTKLSVKDINIKGKRVLMRVEFNLPMENDKITSNYRLVSTLPTIKLCIDRGAKNIIILSHIGKPGRQVSLRPVAKELQRLLKRPVQFVNSCVGEIVEETCSKADNGSVTLLENVRFHIEETGTGLDQCGNEIFATKEDIAYFRSRLSKLGDVFVNDAFGVAQRWHSSMTGINLEIRAAGLLMEKEIHFFTELIKNPERPFYCILGGAKVGDKIKLIENLLDKIDGLVIGGGMAFTFLKIKNKIPIGDSLFDNDAADCVTRIMKRADLLGLNIHLPVDFVTAERMDSEDNLRVDSIKNGIPAGRAGFDSGPATTKKFTNAIANAKTIFWNGPMGVFERSQFSKGTRDLMSSVAELTKNGVKTVIGGGDSAAACYKFGMTDAMTHVSTGGGASIAFLEGRELPGITYLSDAYEFHC